MNVQPLTPKELARVRAGRDQCSERVQRLIATVDELERQLVFANLPADVLHDPTCERALLTLMFAHGLDELCESLDTLDFFDPWHRWLFTELRLAWEAGEPIACQAALARWFSSPACKARCRAAGIEEKPAVIILETFRQDFAQLAHKNYLVKVLRTERVKREFAKVLSAAARFVANNPNEIIPAVTKLQKGAGGLWALLADVMPEELGVSCDE